MPKRWVIPDIHGCNKTLRALFEYYINPSKEDELYFLGDYIDRGPDSKGVLDFLMDLQKQGFSVNAIKGNHEESCVKACMEEQNLGRNFLGFRKRNLSKLAWRQYGGKETMENFGLNDLNDMPAEYLEWMLDLPVYLELPGYLLVHAGLDFSLDDPYQDEHSMMWLRDFDPRPEKIDGRILIHGHVPIALEDIFILRDRRQQFGHIDLDNGVYMAGREGYGNLVALELNSMELFSQYNLDY